MLVVKRTAARIPRSGMSKLRRHSRCLFTPTDHRMRLASVLTPLDEHHLKLAAQCGVEEITVRYPGTMLADLLTGSFVVETIFQIPGLGAFFVNSSLNRDYPLLMGLVLLYAALLLLLNLLADFLIAKLDPRVRYE